MDAEVKEPHEEVLARLPGGLGWDRDLDHILRESLKGGLGRAVEESAAIADEPGGHVESNGSPDVVPLIRKDIS